MEKVATICPPEIVFPQSSSRRIASGVGQAAGVEKLSTRPVCVGARADGAHLPEGVVVWLSALRFGNCEAGPGSGFSTIKVTFTVGAAALVNEKLTPP